MQAYIPEFILAGLAMLLLLAETFCKKTPKFIFGLIGAAGTLAMLPFYMEGLYDNIYIILALVATAVTLLLSVDFRAVINLSSNDSKSQDGTGEFYILPLLACVGITSLCKASNLVELFVSLEVLTAQRGCGGKNGGDDRSGEADLLFRYRGQSADGTGGA